MRALDQFLLRHSTGYIEDRVRVYGTEHILPGFSELPNPIRGAYGGGLKDCDVRQIAVEQLASALGLSPKQTVERYEVVVTPGPFAHAGIIRYKQRRPTCGVPLLALG